jgi:hypothetical protein
VPPLKEDAVEVIAADVKVLRIAASSTLAAACRG